MECPGPSLGENWECKVIGGPPEAGPGDAVSPPKNGHPALTYMSKNLGIAKTTRYWDCCKPSCGWPGKAEVSTPVKTCAVDGETKVGSNDVSVCDPKGKSHMCSNQQPWYDEELGVSFAYAAGRIEGITEAEWCCACYHLVFDKSRDLPDMVVQFSNTGADLQGNHIDIQAPGGGFGIFDEACPAQWGVKAKDWGKTYGGTMAAGWGKEGCNKLPRELRKGCEWQFDYLGDNPPVKEFYRVACPSELISPTLCKRKDDAELHARPPSNGRRRRTPKEDGRRRRRTPSPTPAPEEDGRRRRRTPAEDGRRRRRTPKPTPAPTPKPERRRRAPKRRRRSKRRRRRSKRRRRRSSRRRRRKR